VESTPGEEAVETFKVTIKYLDYYINLVDKAVAGFERIDSSFERNSVVGEMLSNSMTGYGEGDDKGWDGQMASLTWRTWESEQAPVKDSEGQGSLARCGPQRRKESHTTERLDNNTWFTMFC